MSSRLTAWDDAVRLARASRRPRSVPSGRDARRVQGAGSDAPHRPWPDLVAPRVDVRAAGLSDLRHLSGPVVLAANHLSSLDASLLRQVLPRRWRTVTWKPGAALRAGRSALVFAEGGISPDGRLGRFTDRAAAAAIAVGVPLVPLAIRGSFGLSEQPPHAVGPRRAPVLVRFGRPVSTDGGVEATTARLRDTVAELLAEDESSWWDLERGESSDVDAAADSWLTTWNALVPAVRPGTQQRPRIWG